MNHIDHEARQNSHRVDNSAPSVTEDTPLLHRFPQNEIAARNPQTTLIVSLLLVTLISGVIIGIYLLVLQNNSENILPPVETPLQLVSRKQWDHNYNIRTRTLRHSLKTKQVIIVQTDTDQCLSTESCENLLRELQANMTEAQMIPYNFLVSTTGETYESLGWHEPSPLFTLFPNSLVLAFIGNFTEVSPAKSQVDGAKHFFAASVSQRHLAPNYSIIGKTTKYKPARLFDSLKSLKQWNNELSDI